MDITSRYVGILHVIFIVASTVMVMVSGIFIMESAGEITQGTLTEDWEETNGSVIAYITESIDEDGDTVYTPHNYYLYEVESRTYRGYQVSINSEFRNWSTTLESLAIDRLRGYENNTAVVVYYDPDQPSKALLERGIPDSSYGTIESNLIWFVAGSILITASVLITIFGMFTRRQVINRVRSTMIPRQIESKEYQNSFSLFLGHLYRQLGYIIGRSGKPRSVFGYTTAVLMMSTLAVLLGSTFFSGVFSEYPWIIWVLPLVFLVVGEYLFSFYYPDFSLTSGNSTTSNTTSKKDNAPISDNNSSGSENSGSSGSQFADTGILGVNVTFVFIRYLIAFLVYIIGSILPVFIFIFFALYIIFTGLLLYGVSSDLLVDMGYVLNTELEIFNTMICWIGNCYVTTSLTPGSELLIDLLRFLIMFIILAVFGLLFHYITTNNRYAMHIDRGLDLYERIILPDTVPMVEGGINPTGSAIVYSSGKSLWRFDLHTFQKYRLGTASGVIHRIVYVQHDIVTVAGSVIERWSGQSYQSTTIHRADAQISAVAVGPVNNDLIVGTVTGELYEIDVQSGQLINTFRSMSDRVQVLIALDKVVFALSQSGELFKIAQNTATVLLMPGEADFRIMSGSYADDYLLLGTQDDGLWRYYPDEGRVEQLYSTGYSITACEQLGDRVFIGLDTGKLLIYPLSGGESLEYELHTGPIISIRHTGDQITTGSLLGSIKLSDPSVFEDWEKRERRESQEGSL